jgi:hypothetical protein
MLDKYFLRKLWIFCRYRISRTRTSSSGEGHESWRYVLKPRFPGVKPISAFCTFGIPQGDERSTIHDIGIGEKDGNRGFGSYLLSAVLAYIDQCDKPMFIHISPRPGRLDEEALKRWYERHGFIESHANFMRRPRMSER